MRTLLKKLEEAQFNDRILKSLGKVFEDWKDKLGAVYYGLEKVKKQPGVRELFGADIEEMYNAMDDALLLAERLDKKVAKALGEDVEIPEYKRKRVE